MRTIRIYPLETYQVRETNFRIIRVFKVIGMTQTYVEVENSLN